MSLNTAQATTSLRGLTIKFDNRVAATTPYYTSKCNLTQSNGYDEGYGFLSSLPGVREWLGDRVFNSLGAAQFTIANKEWENSVSILRTSIDDDRLGMYDLVMEELAVEAACHPDEVLFDLQTKGDSQVCFDGQYFFDTDHSWGSSGTQSNRLSASITTAKWQANYAYAAGAVVQSGGSQYVATIGGTSAGAAAWKTSTAYTAGNTVVNGSNQYICVTGGTSAGSGGPTGTGASITDNTVTWAFQSVTGGPTGITAAIADGSVSWAYEGIVLPTEQDFRRAYFQLQSAILGFKKDNGKPFFRPTLTPVSDFVLEVPSAMQDIAEKALLKSLINGGESNRVVNLPKIVPIPSFTDNYSIYLQRVGQPLKPYVFQSRKPLTRFMKGLEDREFKDVKFMTDARYNLGYLAWWQTAKLTFS